MPSFKTLVAALVCASTASCLAVPAINFSLPTVNLTVADSTNLTAAAINDTLLRPSAAANNTTGPLPANETATPTTAEASTLVEREQPTLSGFATACIKCRMGNGVWKTRGDPNGHLLQCWCPNTRGKMIKSSVHLNTRLGNDDGTLVWFSKDYRGTCRNYELRNGGREFHMLCDARQENFGSRTWINLNAYIGNVDGELVMS